MEIREIAKDFIKLYPSPEAATLDLAYLVKEGGVNLTTANHLATVAAAKQRASIQKVSEIGLRKKVARVGGADVVILDPKKWAVSEVEEQLTANMDWYGLTGYLKEAIKANARIKNLIESASFRLLFGEEEQEIPPVPDVEQIKWEDFWNEEFKEQPPVKKYIPTEGEILVGMLSPNEYAQYLNNNSRAAAVIEVLKNGAIKLFTEESGNNLTIGGSVKVGNVECLTTETLIYDDEELKSFVKFAEGLNDEHRNLTKALNSVNARVKNKLEELTRETEEKFRLQVTEFKNRKNAFEQRRKEAEALYMERKAAADAIWRSNYTKIENLVAAESQRRESMRNQEKSRLLTLLSKTQIFVPEIHRATVNALSK